MPTTAVLASLDKSLPFLDESTRARYLRETLAELDQLKSWWHLRAKESAAAAAIVLKISERRAMLLGLDQPAHTRVEIIGRQTADQPNSTALLIAELDRIANERPVGNGAAHEGEGDPPAA